MKFKLILVLIFVSCCTHSKSQNLVSNGSFETFTLCPFSLGAINQATGWVVSKGTPDFYHTCAVTSPLTGIPQNICGYQQPFAGDGYAGMLCYSSFASGYNPDQREYATGTLSQPLTIGTKYFVYIRVVRMNASSHAVNNIGAKFLTSSTTSLPISNSAHVFSTSVITDTLNWTTIQGSFVADSNYTHISIGNHFNDSLTTINSVAPVTFGWNAYYFVDEICMTTDSLGCFEQTGTNDYTTNNLFTIKPNPVVDVLYIETKWNVEAEIIIYNSIGKVYLKQKITNSATVDVSFLSEGIYIYEIRKSDGRSLKKGKLLKMDSTKN
ncbi:MAG: T9SS type A sorting domain-containing protein [Bacteroidetes bacterium]|nr:T9SS type A sorting domain-containing protein [Bacteroidota bacterium]